MIYLFTITSVGSVLLDVHEFLLTNNFAVFFNFLYFLSFQDYSINEWLSKGASKEKIVVGFATYGRSFTLASPNLTDINAPAIKGGNAGKFTKETGFLAFFEVSLVFLNFLLSKF